MVGALARNFRSANRSEVLAHFLLSTWGTVTSVSPMDDYGIDLYCTLTENIGLRSIVTDYYSVQVKSTDDPWLFDTPESIQWLFVIVHVVGSIAKKGLVQALSVVHYRGHVIGTGAASCNARRSARANSSIVVEVG